MKLHANPVFFILVLLIRGSASALFKAFCVSLIDKKPIRTSKAKTNLLFITLPTIFLYLLQLSLKWYIAALDGRKEEKGFEIGHLMIRYLFSRKIEQYFVHFFVTFMVISRCLRALVKIFNELMGQRGEAFSQPRILVRQDSFEQSREVSYQVVARILAG
jgi:phosphatidylglycerophosphate synthase